MNQIKENNRISKEKLDKYFRVSEEAFEEAQKNINQKKESEAKEILDMAKRYIDDAHYFKDKGDFVNAFAALNYSHGWLDTGSRLGIFNVTNNRLFVVK